MENEDISINAKNVKKDVTIEEVGLGSWDKYINMSVDKALLEIFNDAQKYSRAKREWYWDNMEFKKTASRVVRGTCFFLFFWE